MYLEEKGRFCRSSSDTGEYFSRINLSLLSRKSPVPFPDIGVTKKDLNFKINSLRVEEKEHSYIPIKLFYVIHAHVIPAWFGQKAVIKALGLPL